MIQTNLMPFNIDLLILGDNDLRTMRPIKVLDIFFAGTKDFHPDGLFSTEIFGKFGEERRNRLFSYIKLNTEILHPVIYKSIIDLKALYGEILSGSTYAIFNPETKDFEESDMANGETGYHFFMTYLPELQFEERTSTRREFNIKLINKNRHRLLLSHLLVLPAGLRDYVIDENGKPSEDEINTLYRKVLSLSSIIENVNTKINADYIDSTRHSLQIAIYDIYLYIKAMLEGKKKLILGKVVSRKIYHSTRNVITSHIPENTQLFGPKAVPSTHTVVGLYQFLRAILPLAVKHIRDGFLSEVFTGPNSPAVLVNKDTNKKELVDIDSSDYDKWQTFEGIEKVLVEYGQEHIRHKPIKVGENHYIGLIYVGDDNTFRLVHDIDEIPDHRRTEDAIKNYQIRPISFTELLYLSIYKIASDVPNLVTRYPVSGYGGIYPSYSYLRTTVKSEVREELDHDWKPSGFVAQEFPKLGSQFFNSLSPSVNNISRLGADYDGDKCSFTALLTDDAKEEIKDFLNSASYYKSVSGGMAFGSNTDIVNLVVISMTD